MLSTCENNRYAVTKLQTKHPREQKISLRAIGYGMPGLTIYGNDALAVYEAACKAVERARAGGSLTLIECRTYRHSR